MTYKYKKNISAAKLEDELDVVSRKLETFKLPVGFPKFILYTIAELFANIKEHARTNRASIVLQMNSRKTLIRIADQGIGLKQSYLSKKIYVKDDFAAIEFALSGLSTKNLQERGFGLYSIRKFIETLGGEMIVESGLAKTFIKKNKINFQNLKEKTQGTIIELEAPVRKVDFYKIIA